MLCTWSQNDQQDSGSLVPEQFMAPLLHCQMMSSPLSWRVAVSLSASVRWSLSTSLLTTLITLDLARWSSPLVFSSTADTETWNSERPCACADGALSPDSVAATAGLLRESASPPLLPVLLSSEMENSVKLCRRLFHRNISEQAPERKYFIREQNQGFKTSGKLEMEHFYQKEPILIKLFIRFTTNFKVFALSRRLK